MNKKEQIKKAYASGLIDTKQLAERYNTSEKYIVKVIREADLKGNVTRNLTISEYIKAYFLGVNTVTTLADYFHVSTRSIIRFRKETQIDKKLLAYSHCMNTPKAYISTEYTTLADVCKILNHICNTIEPIANNYTPVMKKLNKLRGVIYEIKRIKLL
ncbi:hypothetical protein [Hoylesella saccharolytica]|uniref:hypothetical protein n=1 Tax=Hoylesella saccharolytica TaxID=633701 RepID=UPI0028D1D56A|nr:hypothetical protein [Hoylesella saccharolytica]